MLINSRQDYKHNVTVEFILRFEHKVHDKTSILQKEMSIEHHSSDRSSHSKPHIQVRIHGESDKFGKLWITLPIEDEKEYVTCIIGFISLLPEIINKCSPGTEKLILNISSLKNITNEKRFLHQKIQEAISNGDVEYRPSKGRKIVIYKDNIGKLLDQANLLLPLLKPISKDLISNSNNIP